MQCDSRASEFEARGQSFESFRCHERDNSNFYCPWYWYCLKTEPVRDKTNNLGSDKVRHKPGCTVTDDGQKLEILDLESRGMVLSM